MNILPTKLPGTPPEDRLVLSWLNMPCLVEDFFQQFVRQPCASALYVYSMGEKCGLTKPDDWIALDFGSGPATLAVALAWLKAQDLQCSGLSAKPLLNYIGIERRDAMIEKAQSVADARLVSLSGGIPEGIHSLSAAEKRFAQLAGPHRGRSRS